VRPLIPAAAERSGAGTIDIGIFGRFRSGKSSLINALVGAPLLPTGATPVTSRSSGTRRTMVGSHLVTLGIVQLASAFVRDGRTATVLWHGGGLVVVVGVLNVITSVLPVVRGSLERSVAPRVARLLPVCRAANATGLVFATVFTIISEADKSPGLALMLLFAIVCSIDFGDLKRKR
jgi:hypothetical protein